MEVQSIKVTESKGRNYLETQMEKVQNKGDK